MKKSIWWSRRDLRLEDNAALTLALKNSDLVYPVYILDEHLLELSGERRRNFILNGVDDFNKKLKKYGSALIIRHGKPKGILKTLLREIGAKEIFAEADYSPYATKRDQDVKSELPLTLVNGLTIHSPGKILKSDQTPYTVFTPFSKNWKSLTLEPGYEPVSPTKFGKYSNTVGDLPNYTPNQDFPAGENYARKKLLSFFQGSLHQYAEKRNRLDLAGTSQLSPFFKMGMLSVKEAVITANQSMENDEVNEESVKAWIDELIWRDFFFSISYHFPYVLKTNFRDEMKEISWNDSEENLKAWQEGRTGYPIVDACMRQLSETGWIHNRGRMISASFLIKDLLINWREGEKWFMHHLIDADPSINNGNWQWVAGTGADASPYFRVFNPIIQGKKFDPIGDFVREWIPELRAVPDLYIHSPWKMPLDLQIRINTQIGHRYPLPIIDHSIAREEYLKRIRNLNRQNN